MIPSHFIWLEALPLTPNGKIDRHALTSLDKISRPQTTLVSLPRNPLEAQLVKIWSDVLGIPSVGIQEDFFAIGGHSLLAVRLMARMEEQFAKNLSLSLLFQNPTIEQLALILGQQNDEQEALLALVPIQPLGDKSPLFCVHPSGGNVVCYRELAQALGEERPFYGLQSVGLSGQLPPHTTVEAMAEFYLTEIQEIQPQGPYFLMGWSLGGLVAYEMAQQLHLVGQSVAFLGLLDTYILSLIPRQSENSPDFWRDLLGKDLELSQTYLKSLSLEEQLPYVIAEAQKVNLLDMGLTPEKARQLLDLHRIDSEAGYNYYPKPYGGCLSVFCAREKMVSRGHIPENHQPSQVWKELAKDRLEVYWVEGNHRTMITDIHIHSLASSLLSCI
jgi:thioesterase domain-containing protein/acyl carrier protein